MRPILLIMWTAFQSFILRHNNDDYDDDDNNSLYHSLQNFLPFHWPRAHHCQRTDAPAAPSIVSSAMLGVVASVCM